jgi:hypothetical protein
MGQVFGRNGVAEPAYSVLHTHNSNFAYEIRRYGVRFAAEATYTGTDDSPFRLLARYIGVFGTPENEGNEAMSMTAPVIKAKPTAIAMTAPVMMTSSGGQKTMMFVLPAEYDSMEKIPRPTNTNVHIKELPAAVGAVHRYSGSMDDNHAQEIAKSLIQQLRDDGVDISEKDAMEKWQYWGYNPPFTLPMFRRNEVYVELELAQVEHLVNGVTASN